MMHYLNQFFSPIQRQLKVREVAEEVIRLLPQGIYVQFEEMLFQEDEAQPHTTNDIWMPSIRLWR
jgi:hypothetical protein